MATFQENFINHGTEIRHSHETKGRGLYATRNFKKGESLIEEAPLVSCQFSWNFAYGYSSCDFCMRPLESAEENARRLTGMFDLVLPHSKCDNVEKEAHAVCPHCALSYCSTSCKDQAWDQYHKTLCSNVMGGSSQLPLDKLNEAWKKMHYPPETASIMLLARILARMIQSSDKSEFKSQLLIMCHRPINEEDAIAHKLLGKEFENQLELLRDLTAKTFVAPQVQEFLTPEGFRSLFALIGRNGQGIGTSSFSVWVQNVMDQFPDDSEADKLIDKIYEAMEKESGDFLNNEGSALYAVQSACNHSCAPNSTSTFPHSNHRLVLEASRDIAEGEEVTISYLDECAQARSRHSRRKILQENYLFNCQCARCIEEAEQPDVTSDEEADESMEED